MSQFVGNPFWCPRRDDMARGFAGQPTFFPDPEQQIGTTPLEDRWRDEGLRHAHITGGLPTCSHCGSIRPEDFLQAIRDGREIHGTDKRYKAYVILPNPNAGNERVISAITHDPRPEERDRWVPADPELLKRDGWGASPIDRYRWMWLAPDSPTSQAKFYFQHIAHPGALRAEFYDRYLAGGASIFYSGAPLGLHLEHIARHPEAMSDTERAALEELRARAPEVVAP